MKKNIKFLLIILVLGVIFVALFFLKIDKSEKVDKDEQLVLEMTYNISKQYLSLRYRSDAVLSQAKKYESYEKWSTDLNSILRDWEGLEKEAFALQEDSEKLANKQVSFLKIPEALAYEKSEVTAIFDSAPTGKKIATLAKHLGVDAKKAMAILRQDQDQVTADAWNEAGDTFQKLETSAVVIKDTCKVVGFVGGIVVTGGASAVVTGSTLAQAAVVVSGVDLALEVSDDAAKIAFGNHNKVSGIVGDIRKITEPAATILNINEIPENLATGYQKFNSVMVALEQFNSSAQEGKVLGIELPAYEKTEKFSNIKKYKSPVYVSTLVKEELDEWLKDKKGIEGELSADDIAEFIKKIEEEKNNKSSNLNDTNITEETSLESSSTDLKSEEAQKQNNEELNTKNNNPENGEGSSNNEEGISNDKEENNISEEKSSFSLLMKTVAPSNDWQANIKNELFKQAIIKVQDNAFKTTYSASFSEGKFVGTGSIKIEGSYNPKTKILSGKHYREYNGTYKDELRIIVYSGSFSQVVPEKGEEFKINFSGQVSTTLNDGKGKPYTSTNEAGTSIVYILK